MILAAPEHRHPSGHGHPKAGQGGRYHNKPSDPSLLPFRRLSLRDAVQLPILGETPRKAHRGSQPFLSIKILSNQQGTSWETIQTYGPRPRSGRGNRLARDQAHSGQPGGLRDPGRGRWRCRPHRCVRVIPELSRKTRSKSAGFAPLHRGPARGTAERANAAFDQSQTGHPVSLLGSPRRQGPAGRAGPAGIDAKRPLRAYTMA